MIKRTTAIFFIFLANIILLAHAVVPHHHHKYQVCIKDTHCQTASDAHEHSVDENNHEHNRKDCAEFCILKQIVVIRINQVKQECNCLDNHLPFVGFHAVLFNNELQTFVPISVTNAHLYLSPSSYIHFVNTGLGLRAPPIV